MADGCWNQAAKGKSARPERSWSIVSGPNGTTWRGALASLWRKHIQGWPGGRVPSSFQKDGLAAGWRRARNELRVPVPNDRAGLNNGRRSSGLHHDHKRSDYRDRSRRLHCNAQRAMVGIVGDRMHVRHLDHGQQRQQDQAHHRRNRQSA